MSFLKVVNIQNPSNANASIIINSVGNVGIGSSSPAVTLDVSGSTNISGNLNVGGVVTFVNPSFSGNVSTTGNVIVGGNLQLNGSFFNVSATGARITGDFSNATVANRVVFQTSTSNATTQLTLIPNGTSGNAAFAAYGSSSDPANTYFAFFGIAGASETRIASAVAGTGTYLPMTFLTGGSERMRINTAGNLLIAGTTAPAGGNALVLINSTGTNAGGVQMSGGSAGGGNIYAVNGGGLVFGSYTGAVGSETYAERMRIDTSGRMLLGTPIAYDLSPTGSGQYGVIQSWSNTTTPTSGAIDQYWVRYSNDTAGSAIVLAKTRGTTVGTNTIVQAGDTGGNLIFRGADGTNYLNMAAIQAFVDAAPAAGSMPGRLTFSTTASGAAAVTERMRLNSAGNLLIAGTTAPAGGNAQVLINSLGTNAGGLQMAGGSAGGGNIYAINGGGLVFGTYTGGVSGETYTERLRLTGSSLGIGTPLVATSATTAVTINSSGGGGLQHAANNNGGGNVQALSGGGLQWGTFTGSVGGETYVSRMALTNLGSLATYYPSVSSGLSTFSVGSSIIGGLHFATVAGTSAASKAEAAITFGQGYALTTAQAGIYVTNDTASGTAMAFATTDSYATGPQTAMTISNAGVVTVSRSALSITNQPAWHAYFSATANQSITNGSATIIPNTILVNNGSGYSAATGRFTATVAGIYRIYCGIGYASLAGVTFAGAQLQKNGAAIVDGYNGQTGYSDAVLQGTVSLAAGDYVTAVASYSVGSGVIEYNAGIRVYFGGSMIG